MIDWNLAVATANWLSRPGPPVTRGEIRTLVAELRENAREAEGHVRSFTGLTVPKDAGPVLIVDRPAWVQVNVDGFQVVLAPLMRKLADREDTRGGGLFRGVGPKLTAIELGSLLAFLSGKVLGQYETFARTGLSPDSAGRLLLVAPNIMQTEREMRVDPRDFRLWVCVHEETHRVQFTAVPWLRDHLEAEVHAFLTETEVDPMALVQRFREGLEALASVARGEREISLIDAVQTPAQRVILDRLTAVMSLLEGHADYVMDGVGPSVIPSVARIRQKFQQRRAGVNRLDALLRRMLGIDAKLRQYRDGEKFVSYVIDQVGMEGFNRVWTSPNTLPTKSEILEPDNWVLRVHGRAALGGRDG